MRWNALPVGIVLVVWTLLDVFRTLVMPRAARGRVRLARILFRPIWRPWRWIGLRAKTVQARERAGGRVVRQRPLRQRDVLVHARIGHRSYGMDPSHRGHRGGNRSRAVRGGDRVPPRVVSGLQPPRGRRAVA